MIVFLPSFRTRWYVFLCVLQDSWQSVLGIIRHYALIQDKIQPFAGPGHWNDPDMVRAGLRVGFSWSVRHGEGGAEGGAQLKCKTWSGRARLECKTW